MPRVRTKKIQVQPALSSARKTLLNQSVDFVKSYHSISEDESRSYPNPPHFVLPDVHGNLMVKMTKKTEDGLFIHFNSLESLAYIISKQNNVRDMKTATDEFELEMKQYEN